jgi:hypothetical protein
MDHLSRWNTLAKKLIAEIKSARKKSKKVEERASVRLARQGRLTDEDVRYVLQHTFDAEEPLQGVRSLAPQLRVAHRRRTAKEGTGMRQRPPGILRTSCSTPSTLRSPSCISRSLEGRSFLDFFRADLIFESHIVAERRKKGPGCDKDLQVYYENLHECYAHLDDAGSSGFC